MLRGGNGGFEREHKHGHRRGEAGDSNQIADAHGKLAMV